MLAAPGWWFSKRHLGENHHIGGVANLKKTSPPHGSMDITFWASEGEPTTIKVTKDCMTFAWRPPGDVSCPWLVVFQATPRGKPPYWGGRKLKKTSPPHGSMDITFWASEGEPTTIKVTKDCMTFAWRPPGDVSCPWLVVFQATPRGKPPYWGGRKLKKTSPPHGSMDITFWASEGEPTTINVTKDCMTFAWRPPGDVSCPWLVVFQAKPRGKPPYWGGPNLKKTSHPHGSMDITFWASEGEPTTIKVTKDCMTFAWRPPGDVSCPWLVVFQATPRGKPPYWGGRKLKKTSPPHGSMDITFWASEGEPTTIKVTKDCMTFAWRPPGDVSCPWLVVFQATPRGKPPYWGGANLKKTSHRHGSMDITFWASEGEPTTIKVTKDCMTFAWRPPGDVSCPWLVVFQATRRGKPPYWGGANLKKTSHPHGKICEDLWSAGQEVGLRLAVAGGLGREVGQGRTPHEGGGVLWMSSSDVKETRL